MSKCYQLICHDVAFTSAYMIRDSSSSVAINDYPHTRTLTHGHHHHSLGHAQSCVSVGLVWSFGTIIKPRMNVFDCRRQIKGIATGSPTLSSDAASDTFHLSVTLC